MNIYAWGNSSCKNINQVQRLQNLGARTVKNNYDYITVRGKDLVKQLGWHSCEDRYKYMVSNLMFKSINNLASNYLCDQITMMRDIVPYETRSTLNNDVYVPKCKNEKIKQSFIYNGATIWNKLPNKVKECKTLNSFKYNYNKNVSTCS